MSLCINPKCPQPQNPDEMFCQACGSELLLDGRYRVVGEIAEGGFGKTYKVSHNDTAKVLKVLTKNDADALRLFKKEARVLRQLQHSGIPRGEEYFIFHAQNNQTPLHCLVMEYIRGTNLEEYQEKRGNRPISQKLALEWLLQLAEILHAVHSQDLFHRDIKPSNIILKPDGQLVLIDFGTVREVSATIKAQLQNTGIYTPAYAAPEQKEGCAVPKSDFFALGRTFIYLLTGFRPNDPAIYDSGQDTLNWRPHTSDLSPQLADFIDRLMEHKADDRPKNTEEIRQILAQVKGDIYTQNTFRVTAPQGKVQSGQPASSRRKFITIASFTAIAAVAVPSVWQLLQQLLVPSRNNKIPKTVETPEPVIETPEAIESNPEPIETPSSTPSPTLSTFQFEVVKVDGRGREINRQRRSAEFLAEDLGNGVILEMVSIPGGTFMMGSPDWEKGRYSDESPQHRVTVPKFFMAKYPVTQAQWQAVMGNNPSYFPGKNLPVERVSWYDAKLFCEKLAEKTGRSYRLPSEAEWEYACRAGTTTPFYFGETITTDLANYRGTDFKKGTKEHKGSYGDGSKGEYRQRTTPVGSFPANAFGLYDLHGNIREWCEDTWHDNYQGAPTDGSAWTAQSKNSSKRLENVVRGGGWSSPPIHCRSALRGHLRPDFKQNEDLVIIGFRVVVSAARIF